MRKLNRRWTDEDTELLKNLHAAGATAQQASVALKRNKQSLMIRARKLGIPFLSLRELKKRQAVQEPLDPAGHDRAIASSPYGQGKNAV
jgi:hypothetical protein